MITEVGKDILGRYLVGTAPAYASYIAVGCGAQPVQEGTVFSQLDLDAMEEKRSMDFEMFRVPITSRGFVEENGQTEVVFSAEVPTTDRYEITEIAVFSAASNPAVVGYDSRTLYAFTREESWKYNESLLVTIDEPLDKGDASNDIDVTYLANPVIQTNATNKLFKNSRIERSEQSRYLNNMIMVASNFSDFSGPAGSGWSLANQQSISLATAIDLSKNSPNDEIKLALSAVHVDGDSASVDPHFARVVVEFTTTDNQSFRLDFQNDPTSAGENFDDSNYMVVTRTIGSGTATSNFLWSNVNNVNIYGAMTDVNGNIYEDGSQLPLYYLALDAIRIENVTSSPLYGMTGYTVVQNSDPSNTYAKPIVKLPNTAAMVEFRLGIGVV